MDICFINTTYKVGELWIKQLVWHHPITIWKTSRGFFSGSWWVEYSPPPLETESAVYHILFKEAFGRLNSEKAEVLELKGLSLTTLQTSWMGFGDPLCWYKKLRPNQAYFGVCYFPMDFTCVIDFKMATLKIPNISNTSSSKINEMFWH